MADGFLVTTWEAIWHTKMDGTKPRYAADYLWPARPGLPDCSAPEESDQ